MPKIKIHYFSPDAPRLQLTKTGDWIDLYCAQDMTLHAGDFALVPLGVSMQLPAGYEDRAALVDLHALGASAGKLRRRDRQQLLRHERRVEAPRLRHA